MTMKSTPRGQSGNSAYNDIPLRQWYSRSYSPLNGRATSSLSADQSGKSPVSTTHSPGDAKSQMTTAFQGIDKRRTQDATPVRDRRFQSVSEG